MRRPLRAALCHRGIFFPSPLVGEGGQYPVWQASHRGIFFPSPLVGLLRNRTMFPVRFWCVLSPIPGRPVNVGIAQQSPCGRGWLRGRVRLRSRVRGSYWRTSGQLPCPLPLRERVGAPLLVASERRSSVRFPSPLVGLLRNSGIHGTFRNQRENAPESNQEHRSIAQQSPCGRGWLRSRVRLRTG